MEPEQLAALELSQALMRFRDLLTTLSLQLQDFLFEIDDRGREAVSAELSDFLCRLRQSAG